MIREKLKMTLSAVADKYLSRGLDEDGRTELPDATPMAPPVGYKKQPSMFEHVRNMVRSEHLRLAAERAGVETFEEADDFEVEDDPFPATRFEAAGDDLEPAPASSSPQPPAAAGGAAGGGSPPDAPPAAPVAPGAPGAP